MMLSLRVAGKAAIGLSDINVLLIPRIFHAELYSL